MSDAKNIILKDGAQSGAFFTSSSEALAKEDRRGLRMQRYFTKEGVHPYDEIEWEKRVAKITSAKGETIFEQKDVEVPKFWSQTATDIVAEKYFKGHIGKPDREWSAKQLVDRVADTMTDWGKKDGYFASEEDAQIFNEELKWLLINQAGSFNSPVWFNVGVEKKPQCSACFILSITDDKESIAEWYRTEMFIFSGGSGSGINISALRSSKENITDRGKSSGPVSFMKGADAIAGTIRSGGKTRRAAKMVILNADHPDIKQFAVSKWKEEEKAKALIALGYDDAIDGDVYSNIFFQNANNSVRVTDEFMGAVLGDKNWDLKMVRTGEVAETVKARDLMKLISEAAWHCADPGMQFDTTINKWHTCPNSGRINASNPCSEYMHLDDSACNLASINLLKFLRKSDFPRKSDFQGFDYEAFRKAVRMFIIAQDILVDNSSYPTSKIEHTARDFRELGLGYTNLGALLMELGLQYDSDSARAYAGAITAIMTGGAYRTSAEMADVAGPFAGFEKNREAMINIIRMHRDEAKKLEKARIPQDLLDAAGRSWEEAYELAGKSGVRNSQVTVLAPTGTISFMMDATTTGVEPAFSLVAYKKMVGGGFLKIVNTSVEPALKNLGYKEDEVKEIMDYILAHDGIEGSPRLKEKDLPIFDCAVSSPGGKRSIHYLGHVRMMAAVQPFISGAISKTVNLPESATVEDIMNTYLDAWKMGLKAIAIYRDKSKGAQPLNTSKVTLMGTKAERKKLPADVKSTRHKFSIAGHEGYIHCGMYADGKLAEIFIRVAKEGSTISGLLDAIGVLMSVALQSGVPVETIIKKFVHSRFEPAGFTENPDIPVAKSILDYIGKFLAINFLSQEDQEMFGIYSHKTEESAAADPLQLKDRRQISASSLAAPSAVFSYQDAPACRCGAIMIRTGSCYTCPSCGENLGSCS